MVVFFDLVPDQVVALNLLIGPCKCDERLDGNIPLLLQSVLNCNDILKQTWSLSIVCTMNTYHWSESICKITQK